MPYVVGTQTLTPGASAAIISGTTYSVPSSGGAVIVNNSITQAIPEPEASTPVPFVVGTQTVTPGAPATVLSGTTYSVPPSGGAVIINNSITQTIAQPGKAGTDATPTYLIGSQTLVAGGSAITISSSIVVSLMSGGQSVVVEGSSTTETLAVTAAFISTEGVANPSETGIGGAIVSIGGFTTSTSANGGNGSAAFTGLTVQGVGMKAIVVQDLTAWIIIWGTSMLVVLAL